MTDVDFALDDFRLMQQPENPNGANRATHRQPRQACAGTNDSPPETAGKIGQMIADEFSPRQRSLF